MDHHGGAPRVFLLVLAHADNNASECRHQGFIALELTERTSLGGCSRPDSTSSGLVFSP